jgi:redox-sensitive bicupin YhaK (pirin superfamily)
MGNSGTTTPAETADVVLQTVPLGFQWPTVDPFLFCVHHDDAYPAGNAAMGPDASLAGHELGADFAGTDGFRMYHGLVVPGFPQHPHRGFETVTFVRRGLIDHSDSLGATARFGRGDTQWLTAGRGIVHSEMFPLVDREGPNPTELFQIWLNLPSTDKMVDPYFTMLWERDTPRVRFTDDAGRGTEVTVIAGALDGHRPPPPPPSSWASRPESDVAIWAVRLDPDAAWELPPAVGPETVRVLYAYEGSVTIADRALDEPTGVVVRPDAPVALRAGPDGAELLMLQGRPIGEPVAQRGPFVMNSHEELAQAFEDYRRTGFGGWPFAEDGPVHARERTRFARHADGHVEDA